MADTKISDMTAAATLTGAEIVPIVQSGDNARTTAAGIIAQPTHAATSKATPVDADEVPLADSAASFALKKLTWANVKATLKTYFDTLYPLVVFKTISVSGQSDVVADTATDTLTLVAGSGMTITTNASTDTITLASSAASNTFSTISVSGQSDVVADSSADTLTLVAGSNVTITTNAGTDTITITGAAGSSTQGKHAVFVAAGSMAPSVTGGCASLARIATTANQPDIASLDFDTTTQEFAQFALTMPKSWNEGTVTFAPVWSHAATTTNFGVVWQLQGYAASDNDAIATAYGTAQTSTDTGGTTNNLYMGPESSAITIAGTPAAQDTVFFRAARNPSDGSDTMAIDARLMGIVLYLTTDADTDA